MSKVADAVVTLILRVTGIAVLRVVPSAGVGCGRPVQLRFCKLPFGWRASYRLDAAVAGVHFDHLTVGTRVEGPGVKCAAAPQDRLGDGIPHSDALRVDEERVLDSREPSIEETIVGRCSA